MFTPLVPICEEYFLRNEGTIAAKKTEIELNSLDHTIRFLSFLHVVRYRKSYY